MQPTTSNLFGYKIFFDGQFYRALNGQTNLVDYSNTDAATVINYAIQTMPNGGNIFLGAGTFTIATPILLQYSNIIFQGEGNSTILIAAKNLNNDVLRLNPGATGQITNCLVRELVIDGNSANNNSGNGINTLGAILCYFKNITVQNVKNIAINLVGNNSQDSYWNHIGECIIQNSGILISETHSHENYIYTCDMNNQGSGNVAIILNGGGERMTGCTIGSFNATGSFNLLELSGAVGGASVFNNFFEGCQREHIKITSQNNLVTNNKFVDASVGGSGTYAGISIASARNIIQQNVFTNPDTTVLNDVVELAGASNNIISSNIISKGITNIGVGTITKDNIQPAMPNRWAVQSIDVMHLTKDTMRGQLSTGNMATIETNIASMNATHSTMVCPLDDYTSYPATQPVAGYPQAWVAAIRAAGLKVYFRCTWNAFEGLYGVTQRTPVSTPSTPLGNAANVLNGTDTTSYLYQTWNFIKTHASLFASGDVWAPMPEPENQGINGGNNMFSSYDVLGQWLVDLKTVSDNAFAAIGVTGVITGMTSINGGTALTNLNTSKYWSQIGRVCIDHYVPISQYSNDLDTIHNNTGVDVYIGEVGTTQNVGGNPSTDSARAQALNSLFTVFSAKPYLKGVNYFQAVGGSPSSSEAILDYTTYALLPLSTAQIKSFY